MLATKIIGREVLTVSNSVYKLDTNGSGAIFTEENRKRIVYADIQVQAYSIRVTFDGSTAPVGGTNDELWTPSSRMRIWGMDNIKNLQMIRDGSSDATVVVSYWGS